MAVKKKQSWRYYLYAAEYPAKTDLAIETGDPLSHLIGIAIFVSLFKGAVWPIFSATLNRKKTYLYSIRWKR